MCLPQGRVSLCGQQGGCTLGREEFLEALLILYQECTSPELMKIHHVANFVNKCKCIFLTVVALFPQVVDVFVFFRTDKMIQSKLYGLMKMFCLARHVCKWF